jgi:hypothetical protein
MLSTTTPAPDRGALSGPVAAISFITGIGAANAWADGTYPRPGTEPEETSRYFTGNAGPTRLSAAGQVVSAASLARFTVSVARLAGRSGRGARGLRAAAVTGGGVAAASLAASAACTGALSGRLGRRADTAAEVARRGFLAGGVIHTPAFGVLIGVMGLAGLRTGELTRPVALTALGSASACLLAPLYLVAEPFAWSIPTGRFPGLISIGVAGTQLARKHHHQDR